MDNPGDSLKLIPKMTPTIVKGDLTEIMPDEEHHLLGPDDSFLSFFVSEPLLPPDTSNIYTDSTQDNKNHRLGFLRHPKNLWQWLQDMQKCVRLRGTHLNLLDELTNLITAESPYIDPETFKKKTDEEKDEFVSMLQS